jgi:tetratricopeptide (TPR) repeat protein
VTETEYIDAIRESVGEAETVSNELIDLIETALQDHPNSPELWCLRGDMIQLGDESVRHGLEAVLPSYQKALDLNPAFGEAYESIGYFYDKVLDKPAEAEAYFRKAIELGRGETAASGLQDVLNQIRQE